MSVFKKVTIGLMLLSLSQQLNAEDKRRGCLYQLMGAGELVAAENPIFNKLKTLVGSSDPVVEVLHLWGYDSSDYIVKTKSGQLRRFRDYDKLDLVGNSVHSAVEIHNWFSTQFEKTSLKIPKMKLTSLAITSERSSVHSDLVEVDFFKGQSLQSLLEDPRISKVVLDQLIEKYTNMLQNIDVALSQNPSYRGLWSFGKKININADNLRFITNIDRSRGPDTDVKVVFDKTLHGVKMSAYLDPGNIYVEEGTGKLIWSER